MKKFPKFQFSNLKINRKTNPLIIGLGLVAIIILAIVFWPRPYRVTQTSPNRNQTGVPIGTNIVITLNQPYPENEQVLFEFTPPIMGDVQYLPTTSQIAFVPKTLLSPDIKYRVTVSSRLLNRYSWEFTTLGLPENTNFEPIEEIDPSDPVQVTSAKRQLIANLPISKPEYRINYVIATDRFLITVRQQPVEQNQQAALDFFKTFGFTDPQSQLKITIVIPDVFNPKPPIEASQQTDQSTSSAP